MDAESAPVDDDLAAELDALRRRAYGPGDGIADDPVALARLTELEDSARSTTLADPPGRALVQAEPSTARSAAASTPAPAEVTEQAAPAASVATADPDGPAPHIPWWRRRSVLWPAAAVVMVAVVVSMVAVTVNPPPDARLDRAAVQAEPGTRAFDRNLLDFYGLESDDLIERQEYRGLDVWSAVNDRGQRCLFVGWDEMLWNGTCVPDGLDPIVDLLTNPSMPGGMDALPSGSLVRFTLVGDSVEVRVAPAEVGA